MICCYIVQVPYTFHACVSLRYLDAARVMVNDTVIADQKLYSNMRRRSSVDPAIVTIVDCVPGMVV